MLRRVVLLLCGVAWLACGEVMDNQGADAGKGGGTADASHADPDAAASPTCSDGLKNGDEEDIDCGGSNCAACVECTDNSECESGLCTAGGSCATTRMEQCRDVAPTNATSAIMDVVTTYTPGVGWSTPADCDWDCNADYFEEGATCINQRTVACVDAAPNNATSIDEQVTITYTDAGGWTTAADCDWDCNANYAEEGSACINSKVVACTPNNPNNGQSVPGNVTITYTDAGGWTNPALCDFTCNIDYCKSGNSCSYAYTEVMFANAANGGNWFGGDDRPNANPRNVGGGQIFVSTATFTMDRFAFYYNGGFRGDAGTATAVTLQLDFRNANGTILRTAQATVPSTFNGGWVWFDFGSNLTLSAGTEYRATSWLVNGYNLGVWSSIRADTGNNYAGGYRLGATATNNNPMTSSTMWSGDSTSTWDYWFIARSTPACAQP